MKKKNVIIIIVAILLFIGLGYIIIDSINDGKLLELKSNEVIDKIKSKESFVLCISQTTCSHCMSYKPKLKDIAKKYNIDIYYIDIDLLKEKDEEEFNKYIYCKDTPTTIFLTNGKEKTTANRLSGNVNSEKIIEKLKKYEFIK